MRARIADDDSGDFFIEISVPYHIDERTLPVEWTRVGAMWRCSIENWETSFAKVEGEVADRPPLAFVRDMLTETVSAPVPGMQEMHPNVVAKALPHQRIVLDRLSQLGGRALLALAPGLGKTFIACSAAEAYARDGKSILVISPAGEMLQTWKDEFEEWTGIEAEICPSKVAVMQGRVVVASYCMGSTNESILGRNWHVVIADESHTLNNAENKTSRGIMPMLIRAPHALLLSGTAQISRPSNIWTTLEVLSRGKVGSRRFFETRYCEGHVDRFGRWEAKGDDSWLEGERNILLRGYAIQMSKEESGIKIPPLQCIRLDVDIAEEAKLALKAKDAEREAASKMIGESLRDAEFNQHKAQRLTHEMKRDTGMAKLPALFAWLDKNLGTEKLLIMSCDVEEPMKPIVEWMTARGIKHFTFHAKTSSKRKMEYVRAMREDDDKTYQVGVCGIRSAGTGITWSPAVSRIILLEVDWSAAIMEQTRNRIHRINTTRPCFIYTLFAAGTIDDAVVRTVGKKAKSAARTMTGKDARATFDKRMRFTF